MLTRNTHSSEKQAIHLLYWSVAATLIYLVASKGYKRADSQHKILRKAGDYLPTPQLLSLH